jgi:hypothetical protein
MALTSVHNKYAIALAGGNMSVDIRRLSDELRRALQKRKGADLTPEDVDVALAALRSVATLPGQPKLERRNETFQIELLDAQGWPVEVLASVADYPIARAAFAAAVEGRPTGRIRLRRSTEILAETKPPPA